MSELSFLAEDPVDRAQRRRAAAAHVSREFVTVDDLNVLITVASAAFTVLFDGQTTIQLNLEHDAWYVVGGVPISGHELPPEVAAGLAGSPSPDVTNPRPGILLVPEGAHTQSRAWIKFRSPRRVGVDEMIVADLLAQAFALAVDRIVASSEAADREDQLLAAIKAQRAVSQAVGILVERHRLTPDDAFERLREASQSRNIKVREIARRMLESGQDPAVA